MKLIFIALCLCTACSVGTKDGFENSTLPAQNGIMDDISKSALESDVEPDNALREVLGDDDLIDQNQIDGVEDISSNLFNELDLDKNGLLSREEFSQHYEDVLGSSTSSSFYADSSNTTHQRAASNLLIDDVTLAWHEFDKDSDGSVSASEWNAIMFHEDPQEAQYRDGEAVAGDDVDDATHRRILFRDWDRDMSGRLNRTELVAMLAVGGDGPASLSAGELDMVIYQEWIHGEVY